MKILVVGSGGREYALCWKIKQSALCTDLYCAPGNAGIAEIAKCVSISVEAFDQIKDFALQNKIDLVVIGPDAPLVDGLADILRAEGIKVFGPSKAAARIEGSKGFMKDLCKKYNIPTAFYERFTDLDKALAYIDQKGAPIVVKADGLAAGKGVIVATNIEEARRAARDMLSGNLFGAAGHSIVIEEFLEGEEISFFAMSDGDHVVPFQSAQDHKRVGDGDTGPNTGGMGAYSPARLMTEELQKKIMSMIIHPIFESLRMEGSAFEGVIFAGLMVKDGEPKVIEFNARFGDPECQTLILRLKSDLVQILYAVATHQLKNINPVWSDDPSLCVVMATKGYPGSYPKHTIIRNLDRASEEKGVTIFHAGTAKQGVEFISNGGRVLNICATGETVKIARDHAYRAVDLIDWPEGFCRRDIAYRAL
jgi:phosphoribosylamine--glycine ligase